MPIARARRPLPPVIAVALALAIPAGASAGVGDVDRLVAVNDVRVDDSVITGTIANLGSGRITRVRLLISDRFLWTNERSPGPDDPSRGRIEDLAIVVPPGSSVPFRIDRVPLPVRTDGRFVTEVRPVRVETLDVPDDDAVPAAAPAPLP